MAPTEIKQLRESMPGETARERHLALAAAIDVSPYTVAEWESGRRTPSRQATRLLEMLLQAVSQQC